MAAPLNQCLTGLKSLLTNSHSIASHACKLELGAIRAACLPNLQNTSVNRQFTTDSTKHNSLLSNRTLFTCPSNSVVQSSLLDVCTPYVNSVRGKVYVSKRGKEKTVHSVVNRFYRLDWGAWIRTKSGKNKKIWKKTVGQKLRSKHHVFCTAQQSRLLDKMVAPYWRKKRHYVDDPYEPYQKRHNMKQEFPDAPPFLP